MDAEDLKSAGLKVTLPRLKILEVLEKSSNHHFASTLQAANPGKHSF